MNHGESGHDWSHIVRVRNVALKIAADEQQRGLEVDLEIVWLGAILHDVADHKFHNGNEEIGPQTAQSLLEQSLYPPEVVQKVVDIVKFISFKGANVVNKMNSIEGLIVQDADRIDAMGAIGIARCFSYGGFKSRVMYDPEVQPQLTDSFEDYKSKQTTTLNHFYEKLLLLKDMMNTESGKLVAQQRHKVMVDFVDQFKLEWTGE